MKNIDDMTIQEMVAELGRTDRWNELIRTLDKECEAAGIEYAEYSKQFIYYKGTHGLSVDNVSNFFRADIPAADQHALEGYPLSKSQP